jgi:hypothetical protein
MVADRETRRPGGEFERWRKEEENVLQVEERGGKRVQQVRTV